MIEGSCHGSALHRAFTGEPGEPDGATACGCTAWRRIAVDGFRPAARS